MKLLLLMLVVAGVGLVAVGWLFWEVGEPWLWPHRWALIAAFDGQIDASKTTKHEFVCAGFECEELLPRLPSVSRPGLLRLVGWPLSGVRCAQRMVEHDLRPFGYDVHIRGEGACCLVNFEDLGRVEVHIYWTEDTYKILLTEPGMRHIARALDLQSPKG